MELITLYKPNGKPVKVNENSLDAAIALGWLADKPQSEEEIRLAAEEADRIEQERLAAEEASKKKSKK